MASVAGAVELQIFLCHGGSMNVVKAPSKNLWPIVYTKLNFFIQSTILSFFSFDVS